MTRLPDPDVGESMPAQMACVDDCFACQQAVEEFERLKCAYDPRKSETGERMISAYLKFRQFGYDAYFRGVRGIPPLIGGQPQLVSMWTFGFDLAQFDAATRRCKCDCKKDYVRGTGYGTCPRIPYKSQIK